HPWPVSARRHRQVEAPPGARVSFLDPSPEGPDARDRARGGDRCRGPDRRPAAAALRDAPTWPSPLACRSRSASGSSPGATRDPPAPAAHGGGSGAAAARTGRPCGAASRAPSAPGRGGAVLDRRDEPAEQEEVVRQRSPRVAVRDVETRPDALEARPRAVHPILTDV